MSGIHLYTKAAIKEQVLAVLATHSLRECLLDAASGESNTSYNRLAPPSAQQRQLQISQTLLNNVAEKGWFKIISALFTSFSDEDARKEKGQDTGKAMDVAGRLNSSLRLRPVSPQ